MGNFIHDSNFRAFFHSNDDFSIINFGYDDFSVIKGNTSFYVQNFYTWHFILSGRGRLEIGGVSYDLSEGESFFIPPNTEMRYFPDPVEPWEYVWFAFGGTPSAQYGEKMGYSITAPTRPLAHFGRVKSLIRRTIDGLHDGTLGYFGVLSVFYELMDILVSDRRPRTAISAVRELIDESFTITDFTVEKLCLDSGFSHSQLLRLFKEEYGRTIRDYLIDKRLERARVLLETTELSVYSIALSSGFSDDVHFMKSFKRRFGATATEYRRRYTDSAKKNL